MPQSRHGTITAQDITKKITEISSSEISGNAAKSLRARKTVRQWQLRARKGNYGLRLHAGAETRLVWAMLWRMAFPFAVGRRRE